jgi:hypothetical protein
MSTEGRPPMQHQEKVRVHQLAEQLNVETRDLLQLCRQLGIEVENQLSMLTPEQRNQVEKESGSLPKGHTPSAPRRSRRTTSTDPALRDVERTRRETASRVSKVQYPDASTLKGLPTDELRWLLEGLLRRRSGFRRVGWEKHAAKCNEPVMDIARELVGRGDDFAAVYLDGEPKELAPQEEAAIPPLPEKVGEVLPPEPEEEEAAPPPALIALNEDVSPGEVPPWPYVFISYRREDSEDITGRIFDYLEAHFGRDKLFMDIDTIPFGVDFRKHIVNAVSRCNIILAVIGTKWLDVRYKSKEDLRRLDDPADFVRIEVETGLRRDIPVIPVLVGGAPMPREKELPEPLKPLAFRNAAEVRSGRHFRSATELLIQGIELHKPR